MSSLAQRRRDQRQCMTRGSEEDLLWLEMRGNGVGHVDMGVSRPHHHDYIGTIHSLCNITGDFLDRRKTFTENALILDAPALDKRGNRRRAATIEPHLKSRQPEIDGSGTTTVASTDDRNLLHPIYSHYPILYFAIFDSSTTIPSPAPVGTVRQPSA